MTTWIEGKNGNRASVERWGSEAEAAARLATLKNCDNCSDCSDCLACSGCSGCSGCSDCSDCSDCSGCSRCSRCSDCSDCSRCSDCSGCSDCSDCSNVSHLYIKENLCGDPEKETEGIIGQPPIPKIENIHAKIFEAVSQPKALDMGNWHTCNTTHCRGGWIVHLAGEAGYALERYHNTLLAAQLIYRESGYQINPSRFFNGNTDSMADMKKLAEAEKSK